jgi:hypothetical protein
MEPALLKVIKEPAEFLSRAILPATVISIVVPVTIEALVTPPFKPIALSIAPKQKPLPLMMPSIPLPVPIVIVVAIIPLRFGLRPAGDAGERYESYSQGCGGQQLFESSR